jgi:Type IX secretion system protein PorV
MRWWAQHIAPEGALAHPFQVFPEVPVCVSACLPLRGASQSEEGWTTPRLSRSRTSSGSLSLPPSRGDHTAALRSTSGLFRFLVPTVLLVSGLLIPRAATSQGVSKVGTTAADFLQIDVGPRAVAMGGAFVAAANDASSLYWNPAGLSHLTGNELIATHTEWLADLNFDYLGVALKLGSVGVAGVSVTMLSVPEMVVRTEDLQQGTGETFDAADMAIGLSYGRSVTDRFSVGATAKYIRQRIWHSAATAAALDIGTQFRTDFFGGLTIGASIYNFGSDMKLDGRDLRTFVDPDPTQLGNNSRIPANYELDAYKLPLNFQFGVSSTPIYSRMSKLTFNVDAIHPNSNNESLNFGFEYCFEDRVFFRGGYRGLFLDDAEGGISGGLAVHQTLFEGGVAKLDYAFRSGGRLGDIHVVGFGLTF